MANEDSSILREVDQELAEDDLNQKLRQYGPALIGAAAAIVVGVAGWQFWNARQDSTAKAQALEFNAAVELLAEDQDGGRQALNAVGEEGGGYGALARLQAAASYARGGERVRALETYRLVYNDGGVQRRVREFARLRAAYLSLVDGRDAVLGDLGSLPEDGGSFGLYAREVSALAALGEEDYQTAQSMFRELTLDLSAPAPLRQRAEDFAALAASGKAGINVTGEARVEDLVRAVGEAGDDAISVIEDAVEDAAQDADAAAEGLDAVESAAPEEAGQGEAEDATAPDDGANDEDAPSDPDVADPETGNEAQ